MTDQTALYGRLESRLGKTNSTRWARYLIAIGDMSGLRTYVLADLAGEVGPFDRPDPDLLADVRAADVDWPAFAEWLIGQSD